MKLEAHDLFFMTANNLELQNFTDHSYEHWTTVLYHVVKGQTLDEIGVLDANHSVEDMGEILAAGEKTTQDLLDDVFLPKEEDYTALGTSYGVELHLVLRWHDNLPSIDESIRQVRVLDFNWEKGLPYLYRYTKVSKLPFDLQSFDNLRDKSRKASRHDDMTDVKQTIWKQNNILPRSALHNNFSKTGVIMGL